MESMGVDQIGITLSGVMAVWLTQDKRATWRRWACIFGIVAQPFWFYAAWKAEQWGIFAMCTLYSYAWARGLWMHWLGPYLQAVRAGKVPVQFATISKAFRGGSSALMPSKYPDEVPRASLRSAHDSRCNVLFSQQSDLRSPH